MIKHGLLVSGTLVIAAAFIAGAASCSIQGRSISIDQAQSAVQSFLEQSGDRDLHLDELMEFQRNFYALIQEKSTGIGAFELLVNKSTGAVTFEPGPDMMWNTKYSMMGAGMMGGGRIRTGGATVTMPVGADDATRIAQAWLDQNFAGDAAGTPDQFYGYYTFHFIKDGRIAGMLSVNGYGGQVWFHGWHGGFVQGRDLGL